MVTGKSSPTPAHSPVFCCYQHSKDRAKCEGGRKRKKERKVGFGVGGGFAHNGQYF